MALNYANVENWDLDQVAIWLNVVYLGQHIKAFEKGGVTGKTILGIDDAFIQSKLRITAPAEQLVLKQALFQLNEQYRQAYLVHKRASEASINSLTGLTTMPANLASPPPTSTFKKTRNQTLPPRMPQILPPPPKPLFNKTAKELLDYKNCIYSGYVKKQGGQHKNWRERFLILSEGCMYYFVNDRATKQKGAFSIAGYRIEDTCSEPAIKSKHPHSFKMVTDNSNDRVYYFSFVSIHVLQTWKSIIEKEIMELNKAYSMAMHDKLTSQSPTLPNSDEEDVYTVPPEDSDEEDDPYSRIDEDMINQNGITPGSQNSLHTNSNVPSFPPRPVHTLPEIEVEHQLPSFPPRPMHTLPEQEQALAPGDNDPGYLTINEAARMSISSGAGTSLNGHIHQTAAASSDQYSSDDSSTEDSPYIDVLQREDVYPDKAKFDHLSREEANSKLMEEKYDGMYLIRGSSNVESEKVLSVWTNGKSRHYKVFCDPGSQHYSLTHGDSFATIPTLLTHYRSNNLPKSEFSLTVPYGYTQS